MNWQFGHLYLHLPPTYIWIGLHCGLSADDPSGQDTIETSKGVTGCAGVGGSTEVEVSVEVDGCAGVVESSGEGGHAEPEGLSSDGAPFEEEESLTEANDSNTGPKDLIGVLVTT